MLTFYYNIHLILYLSFCLALCCYIPANCSRKSCPDSGPGPSRVVVRISSAYSRSSNLIPFSPSGLRDPRGFIGDGSTRLTCTVVPRNLKTFRHRLWNLGRSWILSILTETAPLAAVIVARRIGRLTYLIRLFPQDVVTAVLCFSWWVVDRKSPSSRYQKEVLRCLCETSCP